LPHSDALRRPVKNFSRGYYIAKSNNLSSPDSALCDAITGRRVEGVPICNLPARCLPVLAPARINFGLADCRCDGLRAGGFCRGFLGIPSRPATLQLRRAECNADNPFQIG
jgi:hypothetical protein